MQRFRREPSFNFLRLDVIFMFRKIIKSNDGVVGIVVAVLLIGLLVSVISLVQAIYVPKWMQQKEAEHMDEVVAQFSNLKFVIDTQASTKINNTPIATSITLGSKELPYLMSVRSYGNLEILSNAFKITLNNDLTGDNENPIGTIKYSSMNAYFIDQSFIYEAGAIITSQTDGNMISIKPSFSITNTSEKINVTMKIANITGVGGKISGSGYGTTAIQTEYVQDDDPIFMSEAKRLTIFTSYQNAWYIYLTWLFETKLNNLPGLAVNLIGNDQVEVDFSGVYDNSYTVEIYIEVIKINAQIGAGWVE